MTAKRRRFLELVVHGSSLAAACREVGVSRSTGNIWKNGTVVHRKDGTVKVVPPLEPLASRTISARFLSEQERILTTKMTMNQVWSVAIRAVSTPAKPSGRVPAGCPAAVSVPLGAGAEAVLRRRSSSIAPVTP